MLVILTKDQLLSPQVVCQSCVLADRQGRPRWRQDRLCCGHLLEQISETEPQSKQYQCQMGFRVAEVEVE
ncbi:hypothetical protein [Acaryochloris sp. IP29b_bin.137]|uniref:hypothetical protein n=1 Tax=Acaryochloris sp. IP29b_bin.137 TaxID=2969217 RepID=UPI002619BF18|nr:hypothetical protein [Acaryochloris sp. IP29b_bin.137]